MASLNVKIDTTEFEENLIALVQMNSTEVLKKQLDDAAALGLELNLGYLVYKAIKSDRMGSAQVLIDAGADLGWKTETGQTILHEAVKSGLEELVEFLLKSGASPKSANKNGRTPFHIACADGKDDIIKKLYLADRAVLDMPDKQGRTGLYYAAENGHLSTTKHLIGWGANPVGASNLLRATNRYVTPALEYLFNASGHKQHASAVNPRRFSSDDSSELGRKIQDLSLPSGPKIVLDKEKASAAFDDYDTREQNFARAKNLGLQLTLPDFTKAWSKAVSTRNVDLMESILGFESLARTYGFERDVSYVGVKLKIESWDDQGGTRALHSVMNWKTATEEDQALVVKAVNLLLDHGAKAVLKNDKHHNAFYIAVEKNNIFGLRTLGQAVIKKQQESDPSSSSIESAFQPALYRLATSTSNWLRSVKIEEAIKVMVNELGAKPYVFAAYMETYGKSSSDPEIVSIVEQGKQDSRYSHFAGAVARAKQAEDDALTLTLSEQAALSPSSRHSSSRSRGYDSGRRHGYGGTFGYGGYDRGRF